MATFVNRNAASYYRPQQYVAPSSQNVARAVPDVRDDYERWYTEATPNNRMSLSLRSGILSEVAWALDRLCRLCHNEQFIFRSIPGLIDGLFDWPEWYATEGYKSLTEENLLFSPPLELKKQRRFALESLFVIRNAALHETNAYDLSYHTHTMPLLLNSLLNLHANQDENVEFLLYILDIFQTLAPRMVIHSGLLPTQNPLPLLLKILQTSSNRSMIISALTGVTMLFSNASNIPQLTSNSPALEAAIRYIPLFVDIPLVDACLNYIHTQISHPSHARAFLRHPEMPSVLKLLASFILHEQALLEEPVSIDVTGSVQTALATTVPMKDHELTQEELDRLLELTEPDRCYEWMKLMFVAKPDGELTQVDFWTLYKDTFTAHIEKCPILAASDVIKNVNNVFPQAQAMVLPEPKQRFVVRGVDRRKDATIVERFKCLWDRNGCSEPAFQSPSELYDHLLDHLNKTENLEGSCLWSTCSLTSLSKPRIQSHVLTHLQSTQPSQKHPSQSDTITLPSTLPTYPIVDPTSRPIPPLRSTVITYTKPKADPPSPALTALLIMRVLFRTSFASADAAPRADADHFGFPGVVEDTNDPDDAADSNLGEDDTEAENRGRKAFVGIRRMLDDICILDEVLMSWVTEMRDVGVSTSGLYEST